MDGENEGERGEGKVWIVVDQIARLETVDEGHPGEITKGKHVPEAVGGDVHCCEDGLLHIERIPHVKTLRVEIRGLKKKKKKKKKKNKKRKKR